MRFNNLLLSFKEVLKDKRYCFLLFFLLTSLLAVIMDYNFNGVLYLGHDFKFHYIRISVIKEAIESGDYLNYLNYKTLNGYGYYTSGFYSDLLLYPFVYLGILFNLDVYEIFRLTLVLLVVITGVVTYRSVNKVFKNNFIAFLCGILFAFCYYRLANNYARAALGETLAMTFIPLLFWGLYEIIKGDVKKWYVFSIALGLVLLSHVVTVVILGFVTLIILFFTYKAFLNQPQRVYYLILSVFVALLLSACFIFHLVELLLYDVYYANSVTRKFIPFIKTLDFKFLIRGLFSGFSRDNHVGIGIILSLLVFIRIFIFSSKDRLIKSGDYLLILGLLLSVGMMCLYPWTTFPFSILNFVQFPYRFFLVASFFLSVAGSIYSFLLLKNSLKRQCLFMSSIIILTVLSFAFVSEGIKKTTPFIIPNPTKENAYCLIGAEYLPEKIPSDFASFVVSRGDSIISLADNSPIITDFHRNRSELTFDAVIAVSDTLELPLICYKGYSAFVDGESVPIFQSERGLISIPLNRSGHVRVFFEGTAVKTVSIYISLVTLIALCIYIFITNKKKKIK